MRRRARRVASSTPEAASRSSICSKADSAAWLATPSHRPRAASDAPSSARSASAAQCATWAQRSPTSRLRGNRLDSSSSTSADPISIHAPRADRNACSLLVRARALWRNAAGPWAACSLVVRSIAPAQIDPSRAAATSTGIAVASAPITRRRSTMRMALTAASHAPSWHNPSIEAFSYPSSAAVAQASRTASASAWLPAASPTSHRLPIVAAVPLVAR